MNKWKTKTKKQERVWKRHLKLIINRVSQPGDVAGDQDEGDGDCSSFSEESNTSSKIRGGVGLGGR